MRPYTLLSCCVSLDGYLDRSGGERLILSNDADLARVDEVRAGSDAILVGAQTVRRDNPRLLVRSPRLRREREARGLPDSPTKVTITRSGRLDPEDQFFTAGAAERLVYAPAAGEQELRLRLAERASVIGLAELTMSALAEDLAARGVRRLMVEGGGTVLTQFLTEGLADELQLVIAPLFVGDARAPRFALDGGYPWHAGRRAALADVRRLGDVVLLRYALSERYGDADHGGQPFVAVRPAHEGAVR